MKKTLLPALLATAVGMFAASVSATPFTAVSQMGPVARAERPEKAEKPEKVERPEKVGAISNTLQLARAEHPEKAEKVERPEKLG